MSCQSLDKGEILSIRWAFDDPNPVAQVLQINLKWDAFWYYRMLDTMQDAVDRADKDALAALLQAKVSKQVNS